MILYFIGLISILAFIVDLYIYRRVIRYHFGKGGRWVYMIYALVVDMAVIAALLMFRQNSDSGHMDVMHVIIWIIAIFFANFTPKLIYLVVSLPDYPVRWISHKKSRIFGYIGSVFGVIALCVLLWAMTYGRSRINVTRHEIRSEKLPASFDGLRIVEFADVHMGNLVDRDRFLHRIVDSINLLQPDIVVHAGDLVNIESRELDESAMKILSGIKSRYGVYSVLGNHDLAFYMSDTTSFTPEQSMHALIVKQQLMGWELLVNKTVYIVSGTDSIAISGVNFPSHDSTHNGMRDGFAGADLDATYNGVPKSLYNVTISHTPQMWDKILSYGNADLTLSGHVHAMQMKLGCGKYVWSPAKMMYDRWSGLYEEQGKYLYINDGVGYVMYPMRINARPEITLLTIRRK